MTERTYDKPNANMSLFWACPTGLAVWGWDSPQKQTGAWRWISGDSGLGDGKRDINQLHMRGPWVPCLLPEAMPTAKEPRKRRLSPELKERFTREDVMDASLAVIDAAKAFHEQYGNERRDVVPSCRRIIDAVDALAAVERPAPKQDKPPLVAVESNLATNDVRWCSEIGHQEGDLCLLTSEGDYVLRIKFIARVLPESELAQPMTPRERELAREIQQAMEGSRG